MIYCAQTNQESLIGFSIKLFVFVTIISLLIITANYSYIYGKKALLKKINQIKNHVIKKKKNSKKKRTKTFSNNKIKKKKPIRKRRRNKRRK